MKKRARRFSSFHSILMIFLCSALVFTGCGADSPAGNTSTGSSSAVTGSSSQNSGQEGTWYEQEAYGGVLTVTKNKLIYELPDYNFKTEAKYKTGKGAKGTIELIPAEDYWYYIDIFYSSSEDIITCHDLPHTDGDGGYHLHTFARTEYVAPPEPVYGERHDNSDPDASKTFSDVSIRSLFFSVCEPSHVMGDMASEQPEQGKYSYQLTVSEDGTGILSSSFCRDITVTKEQLEGLADQFESSTLPSLNGIDIYTEEMPEDTPEYDLTIEFDSGEHYYSHANGKDISLEWESDGYAFHQYLFYLFVDAGYNMWTQEFHSTQAMKRIGFAKGESAGYTIGKDCVREERFGTAYDYDVYCDYPIFPAEGDAPQALTKTLQELSDYYKGLAFADLERDYKEMADVSKSVWKKADRRYAYSFYAMDQYGYAKNLFYFMISEGHSNSLGIGKYGYGYYPHYYYCIDTENGRILSLSDLFNDTDKLCQAVTDRLCEYYQHSTTFIEYFTSEKYQSLLKETLTLPDTKGGIGVRPTYDGLTLSFPENLSKDGDYSMNLTLYYDSVQDILNEKYCNVY